MKAILACRIRRLNREFAVAKMLGHDLAPFVRRARSLSVAYLAAEEVAP